MSKTLFATVILAAFILPIVQPARAGNGVFLPQNPEDLRPVRTSDLPTPAPRVRIDIPPAYVPPVAVKAQDVLRLSAGQSETISLNENAASVVVANPAHATVFLDNARTLVIVPRAAGATNFKVLNRAGKVILNQPIVVNDTDNKNYVRVTRICGNTPNCQPSSTYYCPDNCVPVVTPQADANAAYPTIPPIAGLPPLPADTSVPPLPAPPPTAAEGVN